MLRHCWLQDPAAEFLAREQEQLGELETELRGWFHTLRTQNCGNIAPSEQIYERFYIVSKQTRVI